MSVCVAGVEAVDDVEPESELPPEPELELELAARLVLVVVAVVVAAVVAAVTSFCTTRRSGLSTVTIGAAGGGAGTEPMMPLGPSATVKPDGTFSVEKVPLAEL